MAKKPTYEELEQRVKAFEKVEAERKRSQEALKETEERYRDLIENANDMIQSIRPDGSFAFVNRAWLETLGYGEEELPSLNLFDIIHPDSLQHCQQVFSKIMTGQRVTDIQATFFAKDGREVYVEGGASPRLVRGEVLATHAIFRDISEHRKIEEKLEKHQEHLEELVHERTAKLKAVNQQLEQEIEERNQAEKVLRMSQVSYKELFNAMPSGVAVYKAVDDGNDFVFTAFNRGGERIDGIKREDVIGKRLTEAFPGVKDFGLFDVFQRVSKTGNPEHYPIAFYKDQRISGWRDNFVYKLPSGEIVAIYSDETERKLAEDALRESEEKYRTIFNNAQVGIFRTRISDGKVLECNDRFARTYGYNMTIG